jgi:xanthine dehydrogenase accessory factor
MTHVESAEEQVLQALAAWLDGGQRAWLATIVRIAGSSPRPLGTLLACTAGGSVAGSLSGGCVEEDLLERIARGSVAAARPELCEYGLSAEENERLGLPCGGRLTVLVEPLDAAVHGAPLAALLAILARRDCAARSVDLANGAWRIESAPAMEPLALTSAALRHTLGPRLRLLLVGAGQLAQSLALLATLLDYRVTVCDPRRRAIEDWRGPDVELVCAMPDDFLREARVDRHTAIVTLTHDPRIDDMALMEALTQEAFYVGALGSPRTSLARRERLRTLDLGEDALARLHAPVGLPIGSKQPLEIAIAILAELIQLRRQASGAGEPVAAAPAPGGASRG